MTTVICSAVGPWQVITLAASLRHDRSAPRTDERYTLLLHGQRTRAMEAVTEALANSLWKWDQVIWMDDLDGSPVQCGLSQYLKRIGRLERQMQTLHLVADEIWVGKLWSHAESTLVELFPRATIISYEDGLHSYVNKDLGSRGWSAFDFRQPRSSLRLALAGATRVSRFARLSGSGIPQHHLARLRVYYGVLAQHLRPGHPIPTEKVVPLPRQLMKDVLAMARAAVGVAEPRTKTKPRALVLGQCFSSFGCMSWTLERVMYSRSISQILSAGYEVEWKEHPRAEKPFGPTIQGTSGVDFEISQVPPAIPIDLIISPATYDLVVGLTSTSLIYCQVLHNVPSASLTMGSALLSHDNAEMYSLVRAAGVPPLSQALEVSKQAAHVDSTSTDA